MTVSSTDLAHEILVVRAQFSCFHFRRALCPSWLIVPDRQKITFSMSVIGKCMSGAWCKSLYCHSSLWSAICDSRAIETTFKRKATAKQSSLTSRETQGKKHLIKGKREERGKRINGSKRVEKRNLYGNPKARDKEGASDEYKAWLGKLQGALSLKGWQLNMGWK